MRLLILLLVALVSAAFPSDQPPHLLLTGRRLHRLKLDAQRQTERWANFEHRVKTVSDSPERGFELALYSRVTDNAAPCKEAIQWGLAHVQEVRSNALIADWCRDELDAGAENQLLPNAPGKSASPFRIARNQLFAEVALGRASLDQARALWKELLPLIEHDPRLPPPDLYALYEFLDAVNMNFRRDLRQDAPNLFADLPALLLLSQKPAQMERPDWQTRRAGLMMVTLDPNLQTSSFVQGWAMEDPKMVREGPGVAYEFLLADPYLPGLGYYNMDPWVYEKAEGLLLARSSWDADACWVGILRGEFQAVQCPTTIRDSGQKFGRMNLLPVTAKRCADVKQAPRTVTILSGLKPGSTVEWRSGDQKRTGIADPSGFLLLSVDAQGKVCEKR